MSDGLASTDLRVSLSALRDVLIERLGAAKPAESAALARQLADVLVRIDGLPRQEVSELDDLASRRAARRAAVPDQTGEHVERGKGSG